MNFDAPFLKLTRTADDSQFIIAIDSILHVNDGEVTLKTGVAIDIKESLQKIERLLNLSGKQVVS
jgi:hypothetical protein